MPVQSKVALVGGATETAWYADGGKRIVVRERVTNGTSSVTYLKLKQRLPVNSRVLFVELMNATAISVGGNTGTNGTATRVGLIRATNGTNDAGITNANAWATNAPLTNLLISATNHTTTTINTITKAIPNTNTPSAIQMLNSTNDEALYLLPLSSGAATTALDDATAATTTSSTSYVFSGTQSIDVMVVAEVFGDLQVA